MRKADSCPTTVNVNAACNYNCKVFTPKQGEHISVHAHAIGWHLFAPLPHIIALFSTYVSINFYPLHEFTP